MEHYATATPMGYQIIKRINGSYTVALLNKNGEIEAEWNGDHSLEDASNQLVHVELQECYLDFKHALKYKLKNGNFNTVLGNSAFEAKAALATVLVLHTSKNIELESVAIEVDYLNGEFESAQGDDEQALSLKWAKEISIEQSNVSFDETINYD